MNLRDQSRPPRSRQRFHPGLEEWLSAGLSTNPGFDFLRARRMIVLRLLMALAIVLSLVMGLCKWLGGHTLLALNDGAMALGILVLLPYLARTHRIQLASLLFVLLLLGLFSPLFLTGGIAGSGAHWFHIFPLICPFFWGRKKGLRWSLGIWGWTFLLFFLSRFLPAGGFSLTYTIRFWIVNLVLILLAQLFELGFQQANQRVRRSLRLQKRIIKDLHKTQSALRSLETQYRVMVENAHDGICVLENGLLQYINPRLSSWLQQNPVSLVGQEARAVFRTFPGRIWEEVREGAEQIGPWESDLDARGNESFPVEISLQKTQLDGSALFLVFVRDLRERRQLEEKRLQGEKLALLELLSQGISHDFNNLLTVILAASGVIRQHQEHCPVISGPLDRIDRSVDKASRLLGHFLELTENHPFYSVLEDIAPLTRKVWNQFRQEKLRNWSCEIPDTCPLSRCDPRQVEELLIQLLQNSIDATSEADGHIHLALNLQELPGASPAACLELIVQDNGEGIAREDQGRIFNPYYTTRSNVTDKGLGLGLTLVARIVKDHQATIQVRSERGAGTRISVSFPLPQDV